MTHDLKLTLSRSDSMISTIPDEVKNTVTPGIPYEVFRNNTTAVEVIVKEVPNKIKKKEEATNINQIVQNQKLKKLQEYNERLTNELKYSYILLQRTRDNSKTIIAEMKKQLGEANSREVEIQRKYLNLQLESEKLKSLFEFKTNLLAKYKREMNNLKRVIKFVVKGISWTPSLLESYTLGSEAEYEEFESDLKKDVKYVKVFDDTAALGKNMSIDLKKV